MPPTELIIFLQFNKKINTAHFETLANIFYHLTLKSTDNLQEEDRKILKNCLIVYNFLEKTENSFSFERNQKISKIQSPLSIAK